MYILWPKQFKMWKIPTVVGGIVVVRALTCCAWLHSMWNLKATQINTQHSLIQEPMLYESELGHNTTEATKKISCAKGEGTVDHSSVSRWFKKFGSGSSNLDYQANLDRPKTIDFKAVTQAIEAHSENIRWAWHLIVQCNLSLSLSKASKVAELCLMLPKYCRTFDSLSYNFLYGCKQNT